ncbi:hypothetical protein SUGI_0804270 [Cryptomeria japonica]|nr:hypothetical protein SUGI_0804270 [Cryptomeria japonica]
MAGSIDKLTAIWAVVMAVINGVNSGASDHKYSKGDLVPLYGNKVPSIIPLKHINILICHSVLQMKSRRRDKTSERC